MRRIPEPTSDRRMATAHTHRRQGNRTNWGTLSVKLEINDQFLRGYLSAKPDEHLALALYNYLYGSPSAAQDRKQWLGRMLIGRLEEQLGEEHEATATVAPIGNKAEK